jgi:hypothetical protein
MSVITHLLRRGREVAGDDDDGMRAVLALAELDEAAPSENTRHQGQVEPVHTDVDEEWRCRR